jgi:hypothetical protein
MLAAFAILWLSTLPLARATNDPDAAASVMYFGRISHGTHLEAFFPTTPKPLLTLLYGVTWSLTDDWRSLTLLTIGAAAVGVGMASRLAQRLGGPGAAVLIAVGLLAWPEFRLQTAGANSFVWGVALWSLAGVLLVADRPRPWLAGVALLLAGLARTETMWLLAAAVLLIAVNLAGLVRANRGGWDAAAQRANLKTLAPLLIGGFALPVACLHDWLLTGRPLYWLSVPTGYTALVFPDLRSGSVLGAFRSEVAHFAPAWPLVVLAAVGAYWLLRSKRIAVALAIGALVAGVLLTLVYLSWRAIYISPRYYAEADAAVLLMAAVGGGKVIAAAVDRVRTGFSRAVRLVAVSLVALLISLPVAVAVVPQSDVENDLAPMGRSDAALAAVERRLAAIVAVEGGATETVHGVSYPVADLRACSIFVPRWLLPRIAVDLNVPTTRLGDSFIAFRAGDYSDLSPGQWILHIASADTVAGTSDSYALFEIASPATLIRADGSKLTLVPVFVDAVGGVWLLRVDAPTG